LLHAALFNTFCFSSLMAGMTLFQRKVNAHNAFWRSLGTTSYAIYYIHPLILYPLAYVFVAVSMPLFIKALVVILTGIFLSWLVSALVLTRVPVVRRAFS
jgi:peptidoglycan/LPS O-acetylase OafA/YrhL